MELREVMQKNNFVVLGNTLDADKYAAKIKQALSDNGYNVCGVSKELKDLDEVPFEIEVLDLCIHPAKTLEFLKNTKKKIHSVVIQPGAESDEIKSYLEENKIPFIEGCLLVGLSLYKK